MVHRNKEISPGYEERPFVEFLERIKTKLENHRRFNSYDETPSKGLNLILQLEGDIEEFLIENGWWASDDEI